MHRSPKYLDLGLLAILLASLSGCGPESIDPQLEAALPDHSRIGGMVDVMGQRFAGAQRQLSLSGAPAEIIFWQSRRVRFRVPKVSGGAAMIVVTIDGRPSNSLPFIVDP